jgi:alkylresorcinol/alkylpyrone synthase
MTTILNTSTLLPKHAYAPEDIHAISAEWLKDYPHQRELFDRFVKSSQISCRHFAAPLATILSLGGPQQRANLFLQEGRPLLRDVTRNLLNSAHIEPSLVDLLITTSCSSPVIPAIDVGLVDDLEFSRSINRIPVYQHGCAGGVVGLAIAYRLLKPGQRAIVSAVELCSLVYQAADLSGGNLVGSAIFGDGATAVLLGDSLHGLSFLDARSHLVPDSAHLMGYGIEDDGAHLRLDRALPQALSQQAPPFVRTFLRDHGLRPEDIKFWLFHPGGVKVLAVLEEAFGIQRNSSRWAWEVLEQYGNMSSASILFVLDAFLKSKVAHPGDRICMLGVGPGLTIESILFEQR